MLFFSIHQKNEKYNVSSIISILKVLVSNKTIRQWKKQDITFLIIIENVFIII